MRNINTKQLSMMAILIAIGVILASPVFSIMLSLYGVPSFRIDFIALPVIISGIVFGKWYGLLAGIMVDILGFLSFGIGVYYVGFTLNLALAGFLAGWVLNQLRRLNSEQLKTILWSILGFLVMVSIGLIWFSQALNIVLFEESLWFIQVLFTVAVILLTIVIPYIILKLTKKKLNEGNALIILMVIIEFMFILLTPIWLFHLYGIPYLPSVLIRIFRASLILPIKIIIIEAVLKTLNTLSVTHKELI
jgi:ECF transporter S component (folate family)